MPDKKQLSDILAAGGLAYGVTAYLAPGVLTKIYGTPEGSAGPLRLFGSRNTALALMSFLAPDEDARDQVTMVVAAVLAADTVGALMEGASGRASKRDTAMTVLTTGAFCGLAVAALQA